MCKDHRHLHRSLNLATSAASSRRRLRREMFWLVYDTYRFDEDGATYDFEDLSVLKDDNQLQKFLHDWDSVMTTLREQPPAQVKRSLFYRVKTCKHTAELTPRCNRSQVSLLFSSFSSSLPLLVCLLESSGLLFFKSFLVFEDPRSSQVISIFVSTPFLLLLLSHLVLV